MSSAALAHELILGRYRPVRPLGSGGMGHVWLARDERTGLDVALKMVGREGKVAGRAEREARAAAALRHPRCQRIYALASDVNHVYIAYEYVPGRTMRQALAAGELGDRGAIETAAQVLDALEHAHGRGIVHRDVKPSNVLLGEAAAIDVRLLDFGLAQMAEFETLTAIGDVPGTLAYVSPERLRGEPATEAADIWAVGVMLWESLAGYHPFRGETSAETSRRILAGAPPIESVRPDLPPEIAAALRKALALDPTVRPAAAKLAAALRAPARSRVQRRSPARRAAPQAVVTSQRAQELATAALPAAAAAVWTGWVTASLPFYPSGWPLGLTVLAGVLGVGVPRLAFPFALLVTIFPLANISLGLAIVFALVAAIWVALGWREPRSSAIAAAGPLLGALSALALLPLVAQVAQRPFRRASQTVCAVLLATIVAGLDHKRLPFLPAATRIRLDISENKSPLAVASAVERALVAHPVLLEESAALAVAAIALPYLRGRGLWTAGFAAAGLLAGVALLAPSAPLLPLVAAALLTGAVLAFSPAVTPDA